MLKESVLDDSNWIWYQYFLKLNPSTFSYLHFNLFYYSKYFFFKYAIYLLNTNFKINLDTNLRKYLLLLISFRITLSVRVLPVSATLGFNSFKQSIGNKGSSVVVLHVREYRLVEGSVPRNFSSVSEYISVVFEVVHVEDRILMSPPEIWFLPLRTVKFLIDLFADDFVKHGVVEEFFLFSVGEVVSGKVSFSSEEFPLFDPKEMVSHSNYKCSGIEVL